MTRSRSAGAMQLLVLGNGMLSCDCDAMRYYKSPSCTLYPIGRDTITTPPPGQASVSPASPAPLFRPPSRPTAVRALCAWPCLPLRAQPFLTSSAMTEVFFLGQVANRRVGRPEEGPTSA